MDLIFKVKDLFINVNESSLKSKLASFIVNGVSAFAESRAGIMKCIGKLNKFSIVDDFLNASSSSEEKIYTEKLIAHGTQPIEFEFLKNLGSPELLRTKSFDIWLKIKLDSPKYIHVQSFLVRIVNYFQQLLMNMDALGRMKAITNGQQGVSFNFQRGARVKLDIDINQPTLVLPLNSRAKHAFCLKFDSIKLGNKFIPSNESEIQQDISSQGRDSSLSEGLVEERECLLDSIGVQCANMYVYSVVYQKKNYDSIQVNEASDLQVKFSEFYLRPFANWVLNKKYSFFLQLERNLENELSHKAPDWNIYTRFSDVAFCLNFEQYKVVRGFLDQNLGEQVKPVSQVNFLIPNTRLETVLTGNVWKGVRIHLDMVNVGIDLVDAVNREASSRSLAFFEFKNSRLLFESYSDTTKLIDLVSNEISIRQSRDPAALNMLYKKTNSSQTWVMRID